MIERVFDILRLLLSSPSDGFVRSNLVRAQAAQGPSFEFVIENRFVRLSTGNAELYDFVWENMRPSCKIKIYVGLNNRNKYLHLRSCHLCVSVRSLGAIGGDLEKLWVSIYFFLSQFFTHLRTKSMTKVRKEALSKL